jgi:hypothetical protein
MISVGLERRLAVVATAAVTLAIWVLPASAASAAEIHPQRTTSGIDQSDPGKPAASGDIIGLAIRNVIP